MRQVVDRITCDGCGQVFDFEVLRISKQPIEARLEPLTQWLEKLNWECNPIIGSKFASIDYCPHCKK